MFVFVGERRSNRAKQMGVKWGDNALCSKTLCDALRFSGIDPATQIFLNLFRDGQLGLIVNPRSLRHIKNNVKRGSIIVGMGRNVQRVLDAAGIQHLKLIHPAARGSIRRTQLYKMHVLNVLMQNGETLSDTTTGESL